MDLSFLPTLNALLNLTAAVLLVGGLVQVRRKRVQAHRRLMMAAFVVSCLFLVSYVAHHAWRVAATGQASTRYLGPGRELYLILLASHVILAATVPALALVQIQLGRRGRDGLHRRLGWVTLPIWLYVSVTGVAIYLLLYHVAPGR